MRVPPRINRSVRGTPLTATVFHGRRLRWRPDGSAGERTLFFAWTPPYRESINDCMAKTEDNPTEESAITEDADIFRLRGLSLDRLRSFYLVAKAGSIARAAPGRIPAQTLYSRQIKELEEALGIALFSKEGRELKPTKDGERLAQIVSGFFSAVKEEVAGARRARVPLRIGCGDAVTQWILGPALPVMTDRFHNFEFHVEHASTEETVAGVRRGRLHLGIVHHRADTSGLEAVKMDSLEFALFYPADSMDLATAKARRARREPVPLLSLSGSGNYVREVDRLASVLDLRWSIRARLTSLVMLGELAGSMGCAVFLPSPAEAAMRARGFDALHGPQLDGLTRRYSAVYDSRAARIQQSLGEFARALKRSFGTGGSRMR